MVRPMFLPFFSKDRGPPRIRMQVLGVRRKRFFKIVAANQRDPRNGKHMEVLGSYVPVTPSGIEELRLRYSRVKFWLAVGAAFNTSMQRLLALAKIIPQPPPQFGWRCSGRQQQMLQMQQHQRIARERELREFYKVGEECVEEEIPTDETNPQIKETEKVRMVVR